MSGFKVTKEWTDGSGNTYAYDWGFDTEKYAPPKCLLYCARKFDPTAFVCIKCKGETPMVKEKVSYKECYEKRRTDNARHYYPFAIKNVIFNPPATIVFWEDGTKTVVKCQNEIFDPEKGLSMAFMKHALGNKSNYFNTVKKWAEKYDVFEATLREALKEVEKEIPNESGK